MANEVEPRTEIPLHLATLSDIAAELDSRTNTPPYLLIRRAGDGSWLAMSDGMTMPEAAEMLAACKCVADSLDAAPGNKLRGRRGKTYFEAEFTKFQERARPSLWRTALREALLFAVAVAISAVLVRLMK
jgi:hypothetical protein